MTNVNESTRKDMAMFQHTKAAYSISEFCNLFSIGKTKTYEEIKEGRLKLTKIGRRSIVTAQAADNWLNSLANGEA